MQEDWPEEEEQDYFSKFMAAAEGSSEGDRPVVQGVLTDEQVASISALIKVI